jgi:hypothetical protein
LFTPEATLRRKTETKKQPSVQIKIFWNVMKNIRAPQSVYGLDLRFHEIGFFSPLINSALLFFGQSAAKLRTKKKAHRRLNAATDLQSPIFGGISGAFPDLRRLVGEVSAGLRQTKRIR